MWWHCGVLVDKKMELGDRALGLLLLLFSSTLFAYYTFWVIITPFVDTDHFVHNYFPAREYAIIIPGLAGAALISFVLVFVGVVMVKSQHAKPKAKTS
jgi:dolichyl-phosphate mannosyltransferase polypeptide 2 regulatory subunit